MKIVIAGAGEVGSYLARMLVADNHDIIIIDVDESRLKYIDSTLDVMTLQGLATSPRVLSDAIGKRCDLFVAVTMSEDTNITSAILAKRLGAKKTFARIDNVEFTADGVWDFFQALGIDHLIDPEMIAAKEITTLLQSTGTTEYMEFSDGKLMLFVQKLEENAPILNRTLREIAESYEMMHYRAVAIKRDEKTIIPRGSEQFQKGDLVFVICTREGIDDMMKFSGKENFETRRLMILGGSRIGKHVAYTMQRQSDVKLIDIEMAKCQTLADLLESTLVINGDGRDFELLQEEGIQKMDAFIAVTGNSETNILSCLLAKKLGVKKTIAEVENMEYISLAEATGIDTIINKKLSATSKIIRHTASPNIMEIKYMTGTEAEAYEFLVPEGARITRGTLREIGFPKGAIVGGGVRGDRPYIATGSTRIAAGDKVVIFNLPDTIDKVSRFLA